MSIHNLIFGKIYNIIKISNFIFAEIMKFLTKILSIISCAVIAFTVFGFAACGQGDQKHFTAFNGTPVTVQSRNKPLSDAAADKISALLSDLNAEFSATESGSSVYKINAAKRGEETEISPLFKSVAETCKYMHEFTGSKFDASVYPLTLLWQFSPNYPVPDFSVPTAEEIAAAKAAVGFDKFSFESVAVKTADDAKLDFGGVIKGYAADKIAEIMKDDGVNAGFVSVGGSSLYIIETETLAISHPRKDGNILKINLKSRDLSVSTSGDYEKTYTLGGATYSHIIDPTSGYPQQTGVASATVIGKGGVKLDALTTAICLFQHDFSSPERGELYRFIQKIMSSEDFKDASVFIVCVSGDKKQILTNKKQGEDFDLQDDEYSVFSVV